MDDFQTSDLNAGFKQFENLLQQLQAISNETCTRFGEDEGIDGRDYVSMAQIVERSIKANLIDRAGQHREGFLRALTDLLCITADGCAPVQGWDPIKTTAAAFELQRLADTSNHPAQGRRPS